MDIRILGAHSRETQTTRCACLLIDDTLAIDAGGVTSSLSIPAQQRLKAILLTHQHYDHIRDIPMIALNFYSEGASISIYCSPVVRDIIETNLLNGILYPKFQELPAAKPTIDFIPIQPHRHEKIEGYDILPIPVNHGDNLFGYQITNSKGKAMFYTGDTGPGLTQCWQYVSPELLIAEVTSPNRYGESAIEARHLTPNLLNHELIKFREIKGYLPRIIVVHMDPILEKEIREEIVEVAKSISGSITLAHEGMRLQV